MNETVETKDKDAVAAVLKGNTAAFRELSERYGNMIYTLAYRHVLNNADAEDITQDVFLAVYRSLKTYDADRKFFSWMYAIALNVIRKHLSKRRFRSLFIPLDESIAQSESKAHDAIIKRINLLLDREKPVFKQIFILHYYEEKAIHEIAELLSMTEANIKVILYRVREKVKKSFPDEVEL